MRWLKFTAAGKTSWGLVEGDKVFTVSGDPFGEWHDARRNAHALKDVKIELPVMPRTFYCVGLNYLKHLKEAADKAGTVPNVPDRPEIGYRAQNALIAHDEDVVIPATATEKIHYEGELVVVIGKKAKHLTEADAMSCVFGYTIGNDVSERSWQKADRGLWRAKNADTFKPMGPWIETDVDLDKMETIIKVNGKETGRFRTNDMIFGIVPFIVELTKYFTLWPGDVIWMGTDGASPDIKAGDVVEIDITGIGTLAQQIRRGDGYSILMPASSITLRQRSSSPRTYRSSSSGGPPTITRPSFTLNFLKASDCSAFTADLFSRSTISGGVLAGAYRPYQASAA